MTVLVGPWTAPPDAWRVSDATTHYVEVDQAPGGLWFGRSVCGAVKRPLEDMPQPDVVRRTPRLCARCMASLGHHPVWKGGDGLWQK